MKPEAKITRVVENQPSWRVASPSVEAYVTHTGGHLGPVAFDLHGRTCSPYSVAPWAKEPADAALPPLLHVLRGDFFCLPFGGNAKPYRREHHPVHGETANAPWHFESLESQGGRTCLHLSLATRIRRGRVDKRIFLIDNHTNIYCQHVISGAPGPLSPGHHAMLKFPEPPGSGVLSTSPFRLGQVLPGAFEQPEQKGYSCLKPGAEFDSLERVPRSDGDWADLSHYPARRGFEDLVMVVHDPDQPWAWTAVAFPQQRYVWFSLKNPRLLRNTVFWISNGGRHYAPWNGRHVNVLGIEDTTAYFHLGLAESARPNPLSARGFPTCLALGRQTPLVIPYLMGVARIPAGFDRVASLTSGTTANTIVITSVNGKKTTVPVALDFLEAGAGW
jgi:hypothetical protein